MDIRLANENDLGPLAEIYSRAFTEADSSKPWTAERANNLLNHFYKHQPDLFFVALESDSPIGASATMIKPWREGNRCTEGVLFVHPDYQRSGIGKKLSIKSLKEAIRLYQADTVEAVTFSENEFPLTWYKKVGLMPDDHAVLMKGKIQEILNNLK